MHVVCDRFDGIGGEGVGFLTGECADDERLAILDDGTSAIYPWRCDQNRLVLT